MGLAYQASNFKHVNTSASHSHGTQAGGITPASTYSAPSYRTSLLSAHKPVMQMVKGDWADQLSKYQGTDRSTTRSRVSGDAEFGAKLRFSRDVKNRHLKTTRQVMKEATALKKMSYRDWKGRKGKGGVLMEAQHLVPAAIGIELGWPDSWINSEWNLKMLVAGRGGERKLMSQKYRDAKKERHPGVKKKITKYPRNVIHVDKNNRTAHPEYNKGVVALAKTIRTSGHWTESEAKTLTQALRAKHRNAQNGTFADDLFGA